MNQGVFGFPLGYDSSAAQRPYSQASQPLRQAPLQSPARSVDAGPVGFPSKFRPTDISGCVLWLDADDDNSFTGSSGERVGLWRDRSGAGNDLSQTTATAQPLRVVGVSGRHVVRSIGDSTCLRRAGITALRSGTVFAVGRFIGPANPTSGNYVPYFGTGNTGGVYLTLNSWLTASLQYFVQFTHGGVVNVVSTTCRTPNGMQLQMWRRSGTGGVLYQNGSQVASTGSTVNACDLTWLFSTAAAGGTNTTLSSEVGEIIGYSRAVTDQERIAVEQYLRVKWGLNNG